MESPRLIPAFTNLAVFRHTEPLDCSTPALDLCVRRRHSPTPDRESTYPHENECQNYSDTPSSTVNHGSPTSGSEISDLSISSDPLREIHHFSSTTNPPMISPISSSNLILNNNNNNMINSNTKPKMTRPFKAYPKDPLTLAVGVVPAEAILGKDSAEAYTEFRRRMLAQVQATQNITNKNMRRNSQSSNLHIADPTYLEKRRKNNEAAKRSRDARRAKEDEIAIRAAFLEQENLKLKYEVTTLRSEMERLRNLVYH